MNVARQMKSLPMPGSHAFVHGDDPIRLYAESQSVMDRVLGLQLVAQLDGPGVPEARRSRMRRALLEERWADALLEWIDETGRVVDVYDFAPDVFDSSAKIWTELDIPGDLQVQLESSPLFLNE